MKLVEFAHLVVEMRDAQKEFFNPRARRPDTIDRAKRLERRVDRAAAEILAGPSLFEREDATA